MCRNCPGGGCSRTAYFSNPDVLHNDHPTGIAEEADNARTGDLTGDLVANFRKRDKLFCSSFEVGETGSDCL